ncbi:hypothetical protein PG990_011560 [Apiospora arundinis]
MQTSSIHTNRTSRTSHSQAVRESQTPHPSTSTQPPVDNRAKVIYCCVDIPYSEPSEKRFYSTKKVEDFQDDEEFYTEVQNMIHDSKGSGVWRWLLKYLDWKICTEVEFIKFYVIRNNNPAVLREKEELPLPTDGYEHLILDPVDVRMKLVGRQIVQGLAHASVAKGDREMLYTLPKKLIPPPFQLKMAQPGWGIDIKMGFSVKKVVAWLSVCTVLTMVFVIVWLSLVSSKDLQNAFVPPFFLLTIVTVAFAAMKIFIR